MEASHGNHGQGGRTAEQAAEAAKPVAGEVDSVEAPRLWSRISRRCTCPSSTARRSPRPLHQRHRSHRRHRPILPKLEPALSALCLDQGRRRGPRQAEPSNHLSDGALADALRIGPRARAQYGQFSPPYWDCAAHSLLTDGAHTPGRPSTRTWQACRSGAQRRTRLYLMGQVRRVQIPALLPVLAKRTSGRLHPAAM